MSASLDWFGVHRLARRDTSWGSGRVTARLPAGGLRVFICCLGLGLGGCDAFSPAFTNLLDPAGTAGFATLANAPGHVVITFVNNADVDERVVNFLDGIGGFADDLTDAQKRALNPRFRLRVRVTFTDGTFQLVEFLDGSADLVDPTFVAESEPDLNQNNLNTVVVVCGVARVDIVDPIQVFVPVMWTVFDFVDPTGLNPGFFRVGRQETPRFVTLQVDDVDEDLNTLLQRNIGIRDAPGPVDDPLCGSVVAIVVNGVLSVPFFAQGGGTPGFDILDARSAASLGGRYEFRVTLR